MRTLYGAKIGGGGIRMPLSPHGSTRCQPPESEKIECDRYARCLGCPYPRHGLFCWTDENACLRTEMDAIYARGRRLGAIAG